MLYYVSICNDDKEFAYFTVDLDVPFNEYYFLARAIREQYPQAYRFLSWNNVVMVHETQALGSYLENESDILLFLDTEKPF